MKNTLPHIGFTAAMFLSVCFHTSARPADFDPFWNRQLERLDSVSIDPVLTPGRFATQPLPAGLVYSQFSLAVSPTERVRGQVAFPDASGGKYPALVISQWAGVYPLQTHFVTIPAQEGWLVVNVYPHDQPFDQAAEFYKDLEDGPLKQYWAIYADAPPLVSSATHPSPH